MSTPSATHVAIAPAHSGQSGHASVVADPRLRANSNATRIATPAKTGPWDALSDTRIQAAWDGTRMKSSSDSNAKIPAAGMAAVAAVAFFAVGTATQIYRESDGAVTTVVPNPTSMRGDPAHCTWTAQQARITCANVVRMDSYRSGATAETAGLLGAANLRPHWHAPCLVHPK